jgi:hypothetical protein
LQSLAKGGIPVDGVITLAASHEASATRYTHPS